MAVKVREFRERLVTYRLLAGKSQADVSRELGIGVNNLSRYERGVVEPGIAQATRLAVLYGVTVSDLVGDNVKGFDFALTGLDREKEPANDRA